MKNSFQSDQFLIFNLSCYIWRCLQPICWTNQGLQCSYQWVTQGSKAREAHNPVFPIWLVCNSRLRRKKEQPGPIRSQLSTHELIREEKEGAGKVTKKPWTPLKPHNFFSLGPCTRKLPFLNIWKQNLLGFSVQVSLILSTPCPFIQPQFHNSIPCIVSLLSNLLRNWKPHELTSCCSHHVAVLQRRELFS